MRVALLGVAFAFFFVELGAPAAAQIRLDASEFLAGTLVIAGRTRARHQTVTLDDKYVTRSDRRRRFVFRVAYQPPACSVRVQAGRAVRAASVANCAAAAPAVAAVTLRLVRAACLSERECTVTCNDDEIALNALCPKQSPATLASQRDVTCGTGNGAAMVAICARQ